MKAQANHDRSIFRENIGVTTTRLTVLLESFVNALAYLAALVPTCVRVRVCVVYVRVYVRVRVCLRVCAVVINDIIMMYEG